VVTRLTIQSLAVTLRTTGLNIQKFYIVLALRWVFLYESQNRQQILLYTALTDWFL